MDRPHVPGITCVIHIGGGVRYRLSDSLRGPLLIATGSRPSCVALRQKQVVGVIVDNLHLLVVHELVADFLAVSLHIPGIHMDKDHQILDVIAVNLVNKVNLLDVAKTELGNDIDDSSVVERLGDAGDTDARLRHCGFHRSRGRAFGENGPLLGNSRGDFGLGGLRVSTLSTGSDGSVTQRHVSCIGRNDGKLLLIQL